MIYFKVFLNIFSFFHLLHFSFLFFHGGEIFQEKRSCNSERKEEKEEVNEEYGCKIYKYYILYIFFFFFFFLNHSSKNIPIFLLLLLSSSFSLLLLLLLSLKTVTHYFLSLKISPTTTYLGILNKLLKYRYNKKLIDERASKEDIDVYIYID